MASYQAARGQNPVRMITSLFEVRVLRGRLANDYPARRQKGIRRNRKIERCWTSSNAPRSIVYGSVTSAEPAVEGTLMAKRDAAKVGANADDNQPLRMFCMHASLICLWIDQLRQFDILCL